MAVPWWLLPDTTTGAADAFFARGYGETTSFVLPSQDLVVAVTAFNSGSGLLDPLTFVTSELLPLVRWRWPSAWHVVPPDYTP